MGKYQQSDEGKDVSGGTLVWMENVGASSEDGGDAPSATAAAEHAAKVAARQQSASLALAAESGVPFCQRCDPVKPSSDR